MKKYVLKEMSLLGSFIVCLKASASRKLAISWKDYNVLERYHLSGDTF